MDLYSLRHQTEWQRFILQAVMSTLLSITLFHFFRILTRPSLRVKAPRVGHQPWFFGLHRARANFVKNGRALTRMGYEKYKDGVYWIQTGDMERLVLSNKYINELRKQPDHVLDSRQAVVERNLGWYNGVDIILQSTAHVNVCRTKLVQHLAIITQGHIEILPRIFETELGADVHDGSLQYFVAAELMLRVVNKVVAKTLVGDALCDNQTWLTNSLQTTINVGLHCRSLQAYPGFLRPIVNKVLMSRRALDKSYAQIENLLRPLIAQRSPGDGNCDILQWLLDENKGERADVSMLAKQIPFIAIAAVRSTATALVNILFDVIEHSECQEILRKDIAEALETGGGWSLKAIQLMNKLDSFIKESQRLNHHLLLSFNRKVRHTFTLSDGLTLPAGTFISTPAYWVARDREHFPSGPKFTPWQWDQCREQAEREGKNPKQYLASSTSTDNLHWGFGRNACPGRFMAIAEIKLIVAWILMKYDIRFMPDQISKPESIFIDERVFPDPKQTIGFKLRRP